MTRQTSKQHGVTLVEVMLTLAISTLLIVTVLAGRNSVRSQAQFSDGIERIKETILSTKSEANTGKNMLGTGASTSYLLIGESIRFRTTLNTTMQVSNIMCRVGSDLLCGPTVTTSASSRKDNPTPWKIRYKGYTVAGAAGVPITGDLTLAFARNDRSGEFKGAWYPRELRLGSIDTRAAVFDNQAYQVPVTLWFESQDGRQATIEVNPATGLVTRRVL